MHRGLHGPGLICRPFPDVPPRNGTLSLRRNGARSQRSCLNPCELSAIFDSGTHLSALFGLLAVFLACIGILQVTSYRRCAAPLGRSCVRRSSPGAASDQGGPDGRLAKRVTRHRGSSLTGVTLVTVPVLPVLRNCHQALIGVWPSVSPFDTPFAATPHSPPAYFTGVSSYRTAPCGFN
jgi:hypothetical protein